jgi:hypothetical protein
VQGSNDGIATAAQGPSAPVRFFLRHISSVAVSALTPPTPGCAHWSGSQYTRAASRFRAAGAAWRTSMPYGNCWVAQHWHWPPQHRRACAVPERRAGAGVASNSAKHHTGQLSPDWSAITISMHSCRSLLKAWRLLLSSMLSYHRRSEHTEAQCGGHADAIDRNAGIGVSVVRRRVSSYTEL